MTVWNRESQASQYALGVLPAEQLPDFERALKADPRLQLLVRELRGTSGGSIRGVQPILSAVDGSDDGKGDSGWTFWVPWMLAACFAILCVVLISVAHRLRQQAMQLNQRLTQQREETTGLQEQVAGIDARLAEQGTNYQVRLVELQKQVVQRVEELARQGAAMTNRLNDAHAETRRQLAASRGQAESLARDKRTLEEALAGVTVGDKDRLSSSRLAVLRPTANGPAGVVGAAVWSPQDQRGQLVLENLPVLPASQSYQFWLGDPKLIPVSGGVIPTAAGGSVRFQFTPAVRVDGVERFSISIEPAGGSATPTGRMVLSSQ